MSDTGAGGAGPGGKPWSGGGREDLADAVRRLTTMVVTSAASPEILRDATQRASQLADELSRYVPAAGAVPTARFAEYELERGSAATMAQAMPFDMIVGSCNPVAPPITIEFQPPKAVGTVHFSPQYEGAPGCVHGAALAGAFDIILTAANFMANAAGPTVELTIRYRKPTVLSRPAVFESWVTEKTRRRIHSRGQLIQDGVVTVEAFGEFADMERSRIASMHRREGRPPPVDDGPDTT
jgi:acyl-coenzyme A thioesterase PaaI-like protein